MLQIKISTRDYLHQNQSKLQTASAGLSLWLLPAYDIHPQSRSQRPAIPANAADIH